MNARALIWPGLFLGLTAAGFAAVLALNLPGQMSFDSVMQLYEGRTGRQLTFNPWIMSWLLGLTDAVSPGAGLFMALNALILFATLASLPLLSRGRVAPWSVVVLALVLLTPQMINYQGIVWKDVLFANLTVAGFVALGFGLTFPERPWLSRAALLKALVLLAVAGLVRQNGLISGAVAALVLGLAFGLRLGWKRGLATGLGALVAVLALTLLLDAAIRPESTALKTRSVGLRVLRHYDIAGAVTRDPTLDLDPIPAERAAVIRSEAPLFFSIERVDTLDAEPRLRQALWQSPKEAMAESWWNLVIDRPGLYLSHRLTVFGQVFLTPRLAQCLPVTVGVEGPAQYRQALGLREAPDQSDRFLDGYARRFYGTPAFSHLAYAVLALAVFAGLALRRRPADLAMMGLMLAALGFAASFLLISIACDYRYLYMLDLAALIGLVYWAIDPPSLKLKSRP